MKRILLIAIVSLSLFSCAKTVSTASNTETRAVFDAWIWKNHKDVYNEDHLGGYIFEDEKVFDSEEILGNKAYIFMYYTCRNLSGDVISTNEPEMQKQLGTYRETAFNGAEIWKNDSLNVYKGLRDILRPGKDIVVSDKATDEHLRKGVRRKAAIPGYLQSVADYPTLQEYFNAVTDGTSTQYEILLVDGTDNIIKWQVDTMEKSKIYKALSKETAKIDSTGYGYGMYFKSFSPAPEDLEKVKAFPADTILQIKYTGRLLDGYVFDTNIVDTAKVHNLYSPKAKYTPLKVRYADEWSKISTSTNSTESSDLIQGFCKAVYEMGKIRSTKAVAMFYSTLAYGTSSSTGKYPAYAPMIFEFEIVKE